MTNWDTDQMSMTRKFGFCMESKGNESDNYHGRISGDFCEVPLVQPSLSTYQPGYSSGEFRYDQSIFQHPLFFDKNGINNPATQFEKDFEDIKNGRKRQISEANDVFSKNELGCCSIGERTSSNEWNKHKRSKVTNSQLQCHNRYQQTTTKLQVQARRSQKLSDKITALQKLVSPYGKTDTASVLEEASAYIMLLQKQNLHRIFSKCDEESGSSSSTQMIDLKSRGLCLVPISMTKKVTMGEGFDEDDHLSTSRNFVIANHF